jgi:hypothetical protein
MRRSLPSSSHWPRLFPSLWLSVRCLPGCPPGPAASQPACTNHAHGHTLPPPPPLPPQAATCERKVRVFDLEQDAESSLPEAETLVSMSLSRDGRHLLVSLTSCAMRLWDLGAHPGQLRLPAMPCATYQAASVSRGGPAGCRRGRDQGGEGRGTGCVGPRRLAAREC